MTIRWALAVALLMLPSAARAQLQVMSDLRVEREARAGNRYDGAVVLRNTADHPVEARIYQTDYLFQADGRISFGEPGSAPRSNAPWISFAPSFIRIPARQTVQVPYTVTVPAGRNLPLEGTYWSVLMVEGVAAGSARASARITSGAMANVGLQTKVRHGIQLVTHISGTGDRSARFTAAQLVRVRGGGRVLEVDVANTGAVAYRMGMSLELFDARGTRVERLKASSGYLYPGTSTRERFDLSAVPAGNYTVLLLADDGGDNVLGAQYRLQF